MRNLVFFAVFALPACAAATPDAAPAEKGEYVCQGNDLHQFVGQPATQQLGAEMLQASRAKTLQWVGHGMMVTMDFHPDRLRVFLTADNRVERASCG